MLYPASSESPVLDIDLVSLSQEDTFVFDSLQGFLLAALDRNDTLLPRVIPSEPVFGERGIPDASHETDTAYRATRSYNFGNRRNTVAAVGMNIRSPGFKSGGDSPSAFMGVPWKR
jgi:hypothetical protein